MQRILAILAGGRSSRLGSPKSHLRIVGRPIVSWLWDTLNAAGDFDACWLSVAPDAPPPPGSEACHRLVPDAEAHGGPLSGIDALLQTADDDDVLTITPVDMPLLLAGDLALLRAGLADPAVIAVMGRWADGPDAGLVEPLPSVWRVGPARPALRQARNEGVRGPRGLAGQPGFSTVPLRQIPHAPRWFSLNHPDDLVRLRGLGLPVER